MIATFFLIAFRGESALPASRDTTFQTLPMDGLPNATIVLPNGKIVVGGNFQTIGGETHHALARLNSDGTVDGTFNPPIAPLGPFGKPVINGLVRQSDGKFMAAGFLNTGAGGRTNIIRFNEDGSVDASFNANKASHYAGLTLQDDGKIVYHSGTFSPVRLNADGSVDSTFTYTTGIQSGLQALQFQAQADGHILVLAGDNNPNVGGISHLVWLKSDGSKDSAFKFPYPPNQLQDESRFAVAPDGSVLVAGYDSSSKPQIRRLSPDGTPDTNYTFLTDPNKQGLHPIPAAFLPDGGSVLVRNPTAGDTRVSFFFLTSAGKLAGQRDLPNAAYNRTISDFNIGTLQTRAFAMQPDSKLLFAQGFLDGTQNTFGMFRLMPPPSINPPVITVQPQTKTIGAGEGLFLTVTATSESPLIYQWQHAGTNLPSQITQSLSLGLNSTERSGDFLVIVANTFGMVTSQVATITVRQPAAPVMTQQPIGGTVKLSLSFNLSAQGSTEVATGFQWYKNGSPIPSGNGEGQGFAFLTLPANDPNRTGDYTVVFTNAFGGSITSAVAHVDVLIPGAPIFTTQPVDLALFSSQPVKLSGHALADGAVTYQWKHNGTNLNTSASIPSVSSEQLTVAGSDPNRMGEYALVATVNPGGSTTSRVATVTLQTSGLPVILKQPGSLNVPFGDATNLSISFNGEAPLGIFLLHTGTNLYVPPQSFPTLDGPATNSYAFNALLTAAGDYRFVVSNRFGSVTSTVATVSVQTPTSATVQTALSNVVVGIGEFNFVGLRQGLVATNTPFPNTTHILAMNVISSLPPFAGGIQSGGTPELWQLSLGTSNRFYVADNTGAAAATGTWGFAPGADGYLSLSLTNFPRAADVSRLEAYEDGRYSIVVGGDNTKSQAGTYRVLGDRRPATNVFTLDLIGPNPVAVTWLKDGAPLDSKVRTYQTTAKSLGPVPGQTGVNSRFLLTIPDLTLSDAGVYSARITNLFPNPDHSFGQPATIVISVNESQRSILSFRGFTETNAPAVTGAFEPGSGDPAALSIVDDGTFLLGADKGLRSLTSAGQTNWTTDLPALVRAAISDGQGGAFVAGQDNDVGNFFLNRVRPAAPINGAIPRATNVWTTTVEGPSTNYFESANIPHGADVTALMPAPDGVFVAGRFRGKSRFGAKAANIFNIQGGVTLTNAYDATFGSNDRSWDLYLAKYDFSGELLWVRGYGGTNSETLNSVTSDAAGNLFFAGSFQGNAKFGNLAVESTKKIISATQSQYATDGFIAKLTPDGTPIWVKTFGVFSDGFLANTQISAAAADADGNAYLVAARDQVTAALPNGVVVGSRFIARLNTAGEMVWGQTISTSGGSKLAIDSSGNAVLLDAFPSNILPATLGAATVDRRYGTDAIVAKFTPGGTLLWARGLGEKLPFADNPRGGTPRLIGIAPSGEIFIAGSMSAGTTDGLARTAGERFDTFELYTTNSATFKPSVGFIARLAPSFAPAAPILTMVSASSRTGLLQDPLVLEGRVSGVPAPTFQWLFNGQPLLNATNRELIFTDLERTNRGTYTLIASNAFGIATGSPIEVTPQIRPNMEDWTLVGSSTNYVGLPAKVAVDDAGNTYLLLNESAPELRKFDSTGNFAWRFETSPSTATGYILSTVAPAVAPGGEVFIAGRIITHPPNTLSAQGNFLARLNPADGSILWVVNLSDMSPGQLDTATIDTFDLDASGHVRVLVSNGQVRSFSYDGNDLGTKTLAFLPTLTDRKNYRFALDRAGGIYLYANRLEALNLGSTNFAALGANGAQSYMLARYDSAGILQWSRAFPGPGGPVSTPALIVDGDGNAVVAGGIALAANQTFQIGTNNFTGTAIVGGSSYAAKVSSSGDVLWAKTWWLTICDAAVGPGGSIYLTGWFRFAPGQNGSATRNIFFGTNLVTGSSLTGHDQFVAMVNSDGQEQFIRQTGGTQFYTFDNAADYNIAVDTRGNVTTAGFTLVPPAGGSLDLGDIRYDWPQLASSGANQTAYYVARLEVATTPETPIAISFTPPVPGSLTLQLSWPAGFHLQRRTSLSNDTWETLEVTSPYAADISEFNQAYFKLTNRP
ncbi:MAG: conserved repeat domain protein [Verrucomicrobiales bacterium]|nr:conserved repeat domain protein [Verrucomicrobiales bacterium]